MEAIEGITQKSAQGRTNSLESVGNALSMKYVPEFVMERYICYMFILILSFLDIKLIFNYVIYGYFITCQISQPADSRQ